MPDLTSDDATLLCDLLRSSRTDPDDWSHAERSAVTRLHGLREPSPEPSPEPDPMDGAIQRLLSTPALRGNRDVSLALNEAYRNGHRDASKEIPESVIVHAPGVPFESEDGGTTACDWPATLVQDRDPHRDLIAYALPDHFWDVATRAVMDEHRCSYPPTGEQAWVLIPGLRAPLRMDGDPHDKIEYWRATNFGPPYGPVQLKLDDPRGNPNDVAVGRFKATFRKFLGVD